MSVAIHFKGLFCHAVIQNHDVVVIPSGPAEPLHHLRIVVPANKVTSATAPEDGLFARQGELSYHLEGILSITGVRLDGSRTTTSQYDRHVPKLTKTSGHSAIRDEVVSQQLTAAIKGYFNHPPGSRGVAMFFEQQANFIPPVAAWTNPDCIAAVVRLTLQPNEQPIILSNGAQQIVLEPDISVIAFWNEPANAPQHHGDFHVYYPALFQDEANRSFPEPASEECEEDYKTNNVECSNSNYP